jgi:hypothetical protein
VGKVGNKKKGNHLQVLMSSMYLRTFSISRSVAELLRAFSVLMLLSNSCLLSHRSSGFSPALDSRSYSFSISTLMRSLKKGSDL